MSAKMKRRKRHDRRKRILTHRLEDRQFFKHGTIPASARAVRRCVCGAVEFSRIGAADLADFNDAHDYCSGGES